MKFLPIIAMFFLVSCGSIKKTNNIIKKMETYTFNFPEKKVYSAAKEYLKKITGRVALVGGTAPKFIDGKNGNGATDWTEKPANFAGKDYIEKTRFSVKVTAVTLTTSKLTITDERMSNMSGKWEDKGKFRQGIHEYNTLKELDPVAALTIEKEATAKK